MDCGVCAADKQLPQSSTLHLLDAVGEGNGFQEKSIQVNDLAIALWPRYLFYEKSNQIKSNQMGQEGLGGDGFRDGIECDGVE